MNTILIYGNNKISSFLHTAFGEAGLLTLDITQKINSLETTSDIYAVLDVSNADNSLDEASELIHNTAEIKELIDLASKANAPYLFLYREKEDTHPESSLVTAIDLIKAYSLKKMIKFATIQVEDIYGPDLNTSTKLEEFINSMTSGSNTLTVDSDENEHYLIHQKDFRSGLKEIIKSLNAPTPKTNHYTLYPSDPITEIELAHIIKDITDFDIEVVYTHEDTPTSFVTPDSEISYPENWWPEIELKAGIEDLCDYNGIPLIDDAEDELSAEGAMLEDDDNFTDKSDLEDEYKNEPKDIFEDYDPEEKHSNDTDDFYEKDEPDFEYVAATPEPKTPKAKGKQKKRKPRTAIVGLAALLLVALSLPSLTFAYNTASAISYLNKATENIRNLDLNSAYENSNKANLFFSKIDKIPAPIGFIAERVGIKDKDQHLAIETTKEISQAINYLSGIDLYATFQNLEAHELAMNSDSNVLGVSAVAEPEYIDKSLEKIEKVENNFENLETRNKYVRDLITSNITALNKNKDKLSKIKAIEPALSKLLGYDSPQTYLLLIQNLNISRSTGGEVDVFGIIKAENGKLTVQKIEKAEDTHSQIDLNGQIPAPEPIQAITDQDYLYMEDVTWNPDFRNASKTAMNLYSYIGEENLDGVISIDTNLLIDFIKIIGEIRVGDTVITAENFTDLLTKDNSAELIKGAFVYIFETFKGNPDSFKIIEPMLYSALNNRNVMVYHTDETTYSSIIENNWGGTLKGADTDEFLYFTNNNLTDISSSKITSEITYEGILPTNDQGYSRTVKIKYTNTGDSDYLGHIMAVVPGDTLINTAKLITKDGEKNIARAIKVSQYETKALYETEIYIPTKQVLVLEIEYGSPLKDYKDNYIDITLQKQPGSGNSPLSIKLVGSTSSTSNLIFDSDKELKFPL